MPKSDDLLAKLLPVFKVEAEEHLRTMIARLMELESSADAEARTSALEVLFRETHSLKGAARSVNITEIESVCQEMESVFAASKRGTVTMSSVFFDTLHQSLDYLNTLTALMDTEPDFDGKGQYRDFIVRLRALAADSPAAESLGESGLRSAKGAEKLVQLPEDSRASVNTIRISTAKLDALLVQAEELLAVKFAASERLDEVRALRNELGQWTVRFARIQDDLYLMRQQMELNRAENGPNKRDVSVIKVLEFVEWSQSVCKSLHGRAAAIVKHADHDQRMLGRSLDDLSEGMKQILMRPFSSILEVIPKFARDVAHERRKAVDVVIQGGEAEVDKRILEEMKDPLIHLLRNAIDHGIETAADRQNAGKPERGIVKIVIEQKDAGKVEVSVADDGAGIDLAKVRAAASRLGLLSDAESEKMTEVESIGLIFRSELSTSPLITDLSGRGLGLAIVKEKVERLGGTVLVSTKLGVGTVFRLVVPLTLSRFRGVLTRVGEQSFIVPTIHVHRVLRIKRESVKSAGNRDTIELQGRAVALVSLQTIFGLTADSERERAGHVSVMVLGKGDEHIGFVVDEIVNEQEILAKNFGKHLSRVRNFAGAAVLGSGKVVPIINVHDLMRSATDVEASALAVTVDDSEGPKSKSLLVVEDSITARTLLKNILESAGYVVKTAVDGVDGFATLKNGHFDLVISDVEMPRLNGLDLTAKIRVDGELADLPVILVTALDSPEDRERGIDVGANAYIVKNSFEQANLLDAVRRLV